MLAAIAGGKSCLRGYGTIVITIPFLIWRHLPAGWQAVFPKSA